MPPDVIDPVDETPAPDLEGAVEHLDAPEVEVAADDGALDEVVVTLGDDPPEDGGFHDEDDKDAPIIAGLTAEQRAGFIRMRQQKSAAVRRAKALEAEKQQAPAVVAPIVVGAEPTLEGCGYDAEEYAKSLKGWVSRQAKADAEEATKAAETKRIQDQFQARRDAFEQAGKSLRIVGFDEARENVREMFSGLQQSIIIAGVRSPEDQARLVAALGHSPKKARELAALTDPAQFAVAIGEILPMLKTQSKRTAPVPERAVRGSAPGAGALDNTLAKLREEADRTGDRTRVAKYMKEQAQRQKA